MTRKKKKNGLLSISPMFVLIGLYLTLSIISNDFYTIPLIIVFITASIYAIATTRNANLQQRINIFSRGAGKSSLLQMIWIFVLAGAFAYSAKEMGSIESTVNLTLSALPPNLLLPGLFIAACFISISIGTSVGTIAALVPIASGISEETGILLPLIVAAVVGGAFFGDNLSFISDTTIVATRTQGCNMSDKFKVNIRIVLPAAIITFIILALLPHSDFHLKETVVNWIKVIPYILVIITALFGLDVLLVLLIGILSVGIIGLIGGDFSLQSWLVSMSDGISSMGGLILISLIAGGLLEIVKHNGGITYIIYSLTKFVKGKRGAEYSIAALVSITNLCTANNTIAILSVGNIARIISEKYGIDARKTASILDTFSCCIQGLIPYGAQLLMASGLSKENPIQIIPYLYYPFITGLCAFLSILLRYPRKYS